MPDPGNKVRIKNAREQAVRYMNEDKSWEADIMVKLYQGACLEEQAEQMRINNLIALGEVFSTSTSGVYYTRRAISSAVERALGLNDDFVEQAKEQLIGALAGGDHEKIVLAAGNLVRAIG